MYYMVLAPVHPNEAIKRVRKVRLRTNTEVVKAKAYRHAYRLAHKRDSNYKQVK